MVRVYARVLYMLSEVFRLDPTKQLEADEKLDKAKSILARERKVLGYTDNGTGEDAYDSLVYILWR